MRIRIFILCVITGSVFAQTSDQLHFERANEFYQAGKYQDAIGMYQKILSDGKVSGEVYFNLGNAYYKTGDIGHAILYYERAKIFLEDDEALDQNLRIARLKTVDEIEPIPQLFLLVWWREIQHLISLDTLAWITYALFVLLILAVIASILWRRRWRRIAWIIFWVFLPVTIIFISRVYEFETSQFGIILDSKISVMSEPSLSGQELFILHEGTKVRINRSVESWDEISLPDGKTGWMKKQSLEVI
jgi:hypothetical protein